MKAKVKKAFPGRPDNEIKTREIEVGETIAGELATAAVAEGWATEVKPQKPAKTDKDKKTDPVEATEEDVVAHLNGLDPKPEAKPKVADLSKAMEKKVTGKVNDAAWETFTAPQEPAK